MPLEGDALAAWLAERAGSLTASRMAAAMARKKDGSRTAEGIKLLHELLAERMTGDSVRHYVTDAMRFGLEQEEEAKRAYEALTGEFIDPAPFVTHPSIEFFGATPDGYLGADGLIECKVPMSPTFVAWKLAGGIPDEHKPQMLAQIACTGRRWCEFVAFDPRVRGPLRAKLMIQRYMPTVEEIAAVEREAVAFLREVEKLWTIITEGVSA